MTTWNDWYRIMLALTMWREASGEGREGMRAVGHVIRNRVDAAMGDYDHVITQKWQFSSINAGQIVSELTKKYSLPGDFLSAHGNDLITDRNLARWPDSPDQSFETAMQLADDIFSGVDLDITQGATHYFNPHVVLPAWAAKLTKVVSIGNHDFYK